MTSQDSRPSRPIELAFRAPEMMHWKMHDSTSAANMQAFMGNPLYSSRKNSKYLHEKSMSIGRDEAGSREFAVASYLKAVARGMISCIKFRRTSIGRGPR